MKTCVQIDYNFRQTNTSGDYNTYRVGIDRVTKITKMTPTEYYGGPEFYDVAFEDGCINTVYNVNQAFFIPKKEQV